MKKTTLSNCRALRLLAATLLLLMASVSANAYSFKVEGIYYSILSEEDLTCEVIQNPDSDDDDTYMDNIVELDIPDTVAYLGKTYSVVAIGNYAFLEQSGLTHVTIPNSVTTIGEAAFMSCEGLTEVTIPNSVTTIGKNAFDGCEGLTEVTLPNSITTIGYGTFWGCVSLTEITIPNSVTSVGKYAFRNCTSLTSIYALNPEPPTCDSDVFRDVDISVCVLYVPEGSKEAYSTAYVWEDFPNIVEMDMTPVNGIMADGNAEATGYYTTDGKLLGAPQRGMNIVRYSDGTAKKVMVK